MAETAINHIKIYRGAKVELNFTLTNEEIADISGWTIQFTLKSRAADAEELITREATITSGVDKTFQIALTHAETVALDPGVYAYDVQRIDEGEEVPASIGKFTVLRSVLYS